ncbi:restriction endonuclease subunit S [Enterobacter ludwigii]
MSWPMVKLGDVAPATPVKDINLNQDELVWQLNLDQVESNTGKIIDKVKKPTLKAGSSTYLFNNENVLYSKLRPYLNKVVIPDELGIATTELVPMKPDQKRLNKKYLAYYLRSKPFVEWISTQVSGAKMPRVVMSVFWQHEMPLPPLDEQERIVSILDKSDGIRQKREQAIKLADDFLRATFLKMFGDPVSNPMGWDVRPLGQHIIHANNGLSRRRKESENTGEVVLRLQDVHYEGIRFDNNLNRIKLTTSEKERFLVANGDILFIRVNGNPDYVGRSAVFEGYKENVYHNDHLIRLKISKEYEPIFLSYFFNHEGGKRIISRKIKTSAGQYTISQGGIESLDIYMPPISLQKKFVEIRNSVMNLPYSCNSFAKLYTTLNQKIFSGYL